MNNILFLCTGNYYRSRFAEIFFNWQASQRKIQWLAFSRGLDLKKGINNLGPICLSIIDHIQKINMPIPDSVGRFPIQVTLADFENAQCIVALHEKEHRPYIQHLYPQWDNRIIYWKIADVAPDSNYDPLTEIENNILLLLQQLPQKSCDL